MNYQELQARVALFANRNDLTEIIKDAINEALDDFELSGRYKYMEARAAPTITGIRYLAAPTRYLETISLTATASGLKYFPAKNFEKFIWENYPSTTTTGTPKLFAYLPDLAQLLIRPDPDVTYVWAHKYYQRSVAFTLAGETNWLATNYPWILIYGTLLVLAPYLRDNDVVALWNAKFEKWKTILKESETHEEFAGSPLVVQPVYTEIVD